MKAFDVKLLAIAIAAHEQNRAYCAELGDDTQVPWDEAPDWQQTSAVNGVKAICAGDVKTPEQSHESWLAEKRATGWTYGAVKDTEKKTHPCMVPYADLPPEQRKKDKLFFDLVHHLRDLLQV